MKVLRNCWYQAAWAEELALDAMLARTVAETPLLLVRDTDGAVSALLDRCPHRFAPLSAGKLEGGIVTCGYHGLAFDGSGACVHNPHGRVTPSLRVAGFPLVERHTALWIWLGDAAKADLALIPDLSYIDAAPPNARIAGYLPAAAHYELLTDNILDLSHADYLHPGSLGGMMTNAKTTTRIEGDAVIVAWDAVNCDPPGAFVGLVPPPQKGDFWLEARWAAPAVMTLATFAAPTGSSRTPDATALTLHSMTPETSATTHYFYCNTRPYLVDDVDFSAFLRGQLERAFSLEDKPMLEKQQARMGSADFWTLGPALLAIDAAAVQARRKLATMIAQETPTDGVPAERRA